MGPSRVRFTGHASSRHAARRISRDLIEAVILEAHDRRERNPGRADWRLTDRGIIVVYDWPVDGDGSLALVRSAWRR